MKTTPRRGVPAGLLAAALCSVFSVLPSPAAAGGAREFEGASGRVRITVVAAAAKPAALAGSDDPAVQAEVSPAAALSGDSAAAAPDGEAPPASALPSDPLGLFAALAGIGRGEDALLHIDLIDRASGRELRFPLRSADLGRFLRRHPLAYRDGTPEDRVVRMLVDLAGDMRIQMRDAAPPDGKP